jgi:hypothetical protein
MHIPELKPKKRAFPAMISLRKSKLFSSALLACATLMPTFNTLLAEEVTRPATPEERISRDLSYLASDEREGRGVGTNGIWQAGEFIAQRYQQLGFQTELFEKTPYQNFNIAGENTVGSPEHNRLVFKKDGGDAITLELGKQFSPLSLGKNGSFADGIVFAGYGITAKDLNYDDYAGVDVTNKIVIVLRKEPRPNDANSPFDGTQPSQYSFFTAKEANAAVHKAAAVIFVNDRSTVEQVEADKKKQIADTLAKFADLNSRWTEVLKSNDAAEIAKLRAELKLEATALQAAEAKLDQPADQLLDVNAAGRAMSEDRVPTLVCSRDAIDRLLKAAIGQTLVELENDIDSDLKPRTVELAGWTADGETLVEQQQIVARNVIALFPGKGDLAKEIVVVGAHYDHVGMGGAGSLAPGTIAVHNGADDNASGTTTMLEVAYRLSTNNSANRRTLVFMAFSGEERGLLGSAHYVRNPRFPLEDTVAMVNLDMVGRMAEEQLTIFGTGTATEFDSLIDKLNAKYKFDLNKDPAGRGPSDHQSFFEKKVPVFHFFTGLHNDYHRPSDDFDKINLNGMIRISDMVTELVETLATQETKPTFVDIRGVGNVRGRPKARAVLGVQLKSEAVEGKWGIEQVVAEGAAATAGLQAGDVVVSVAGKPIVERDDITKVLSEKRPGDKVEVKYLRNGQEMTVEVALGRG